MDEHINRKGSIEFIREKQCHRCSEIGSCGGCAVLVALKLLEEVPAADVRPVVLCRDCVYYKLDPLAHVMACVHDADEIDGYYSGFMTYPNDDWFCADGKKMEES